MRWLPLLLLFVFACRSEDPLVEQYDDAYRATQSRLTETAAALDPLFDQLPEPVRVSLRASVEEIQQLSLAEFLAENPMEELDLQTTLRSINDILDRFERSRAWTLTPEQRALYNELKTKVEEHREPVERFVAKQKPSQDPQKMSMAILFEKILTMDADTFVANSMVGPDEFTASMRESLKQWESIYLAVLMSDMEGVIE